MEPDATAQQRLADAYTANRESLYRLCRRLLHRRDDAEDAVQEAFARAAGAILRGQCEPAPYLHVTARNICLNLLQAHRRRDVELDPEQCSTAPGPEALALDRLLLSDAWSGLSARDRDLLAHSFAGFAYGEIAARSGISAKSVSVGLVRARARVRQASREWAGAILLGLPCHSRAMRLRLHHALTTRLHRVLHPAVAELASLAGAIALLGAADVPPALSAAPSPRVAGAATAATIGVRGNGASPGLHGVAAVPANAPHLVARSARAATPPPAPASPGLVAAVAGPYMNVLAASPDYAQDHTVFAGGRAPICAACGVLFTSHDGGLHWRRLPAVGYQGDAIRLSPGWPSDHRMFTGTTLGVEESDDGGASFRMVLPLPGPIAVTSDGAGGDRIVVASKSLLWTYDTATGALSGGTPLPAEFLATSLQPDSDGVHVEVGGFRESTLAIDAEVVRCTVTGCGAVQVMPGGGAASVSAWPGGGDGATLVWTDGGDVYASSDSGATFRRFDMAGRRAAAVATGTLLGAPVVVVSYETLDASGAGVENHLAYGSPGSTELSEVDGAMPGFGVGPIALLPDGRLLALQTQGGLSPITYCSDDGGRSWSANAG